MLRYIFSAGFLVWAIGFLWFAFDLPQPASNQKTDAVIVPTGGAGRIARGLEVLDKGYAGRMLVTGVDPEVKPGEFAAQFEVPDRQMQCCVTLGFRAVDTRGNASETAEWVKDNNVKSLRIVTTDWHMQRAAGELDRQLPDTVKVVRDAVPSDPSIATLFLEYHKVIASSLAGLVNF
ncbi:MAG: YdcF family protein [Pseudomonadota bacterium]|nr:YdcF family protein [Pseudomonadota bacterium]